MEIKIKSRIQRRNIHIWLNKGVNEKTRKTKKIKRIYKITSIDKIEIIKKMKQESNHIPIVSADMTNEQNTWVTTKYFKTTPKIFNREIKKDNKRKGNCRNWENEIILE